MTSGQECRTGDGLPRDGGRWSVFGLPGPYESRTRVSGNHETAPDFRAVAAHLSYNGARHRAETGSDTKKNPSKNPSPWNWRWIHWSNAARLSLLEQ